MEIRVESWKFGRDRFNEIMEKYGSKKRAIALATKGDEEALDAAEDLSIRGKPIPIGSYVPSDRNLQNGAR